MRRALVVTTTVLALLGIAASVEHLLDAEHYNPGFHTFPNVMRLHVTLGALYLALALAQFTPGVRARWPALHRALGRLAVSAGLVAGATALVIAALFPFSGASEVAVIVPFAVFFVGSLARGIWLARARDFALHREWMIRALAVGTSIATMRLIFVPALLLLGEPSDERARELSTPSFAIAFALHSLVAELWVRVTRPLGGLAPLRAAGVRQAGERV